MSIETFQSLRFNKASEKTIDLANGIINDYLKQGYSLTLRQLYYQFVARGLMENSQRNYKNLGELLSKARLAGRVDWSAMEDRTRNLAGGSWGWDDVGHYVQSIGSDYVKDLWEGQDHYVEVWVEKEALAGVVERACSELRVAFFSCRGYVSQSEQYKAGKRFAGKQREGKTCTLFHLGDHDPSGMDMTRDNQDRLSMFSSFGVTVERIALNMEQVEELNPPPNPAKESDVRHDKYVEEYGHSSWELDALDPSYINALVDEKVRALIDEPRMQAMRDLERAGRTELEAIADNYDSIRDYLIAEGLVEYPDED